MKVFSGFVLKCVWIYASIDSYWLACNITSSSNESEKSSDQVSSGEITFIVASWTLEKIVSKRSLSLELSRDSRSFEWPFYVCCLNVRKKRSPRSAPFLWRLFCLRPERYRCLPAVPVWAVAQALLDIVLLLVIHSFVIFFFWVFFFRW